MTSTPVYPQVLNSASVIIQPADTTTLKTLYTAPSTGAWCMEIAVTSDETANARILSFYTNEAGTDRLIGSINIPVNSGFNGTAATVYVLKSTQFGYASSGISTGLLMDNNGNPYIQLKASEILKVKSQSTLATGKTITVRATTREF
jgi:hypothetical protein